VSALHAEGVDENDVAALATLRAWCQSGEAARIRERASLSQHEIAAAALTSQGNVSRWERGEASPHGSAAIRYLAILTLIEGLWP
jgi:DNA-binding transcriptional regulator YiaG